MIISLKKTAVGRLASRGFDRRNPDVASSCTN
jgi:hypothetical protein